MKSSEIPDRYCQRCGKLLVQRPKEYPGVFSRRRFCNQKCNGFQVGHAVSDSHQETSRRLMREIQARKPPPDPDEVRFHRSYVCNLETGCWDWIRGTFQQTGYGSFRKNGGNQGTAHAFSYDLHKGTVPTGLELDHLRRNRACCNPDHLEAVTHRENILRGVGLSAIRAKQTHCIHGHPFDEENTYYTKRGGRDCKQCARNRRCTQSTTIQKQGVLL
jgi:hypothetical protein